MNKLTKIALASLLVTASTIASADTPADITAAFTGGQANVALVASGVIGLAAIMTGVGLVIRFLSK